MSLFGCSPGSSRGYPRAVELFGKNLCIPLKERTWKQLVTLNTLHWYYEDLEPTDIARRYDEITRKHESVVYFLFFIFFLIILV